MFHGASVCVRVLVIAIEVKARMLCSHWGLQDAAVAVTSMTDLVHDLDGCTTDFLDALLAHAEDDLEVITWRFRIALESGDMDDIWGLAVNRNLLRKLVHELLSELNMRALADVVAFDPTDLG